MLSNVKNKIIRHVIANEMKQSFFVTASCLALTKRIFVVLLCCLFFVSCDSEKKEKELTDTEKHTADSISKVNQKRVVDSLKKLNPLLMLPPDSTFTGDYIDKYPNGITKFKGFYRFGKKHGQWISFYQNGLPWSELHFDKGIRSGINITYFENGKERYKGIYKNDKRDSIWLFFDSIGNLAERLQYKNDKVIQKLPLK